MIRWILMLVLTVPGCCACGQTGFYGPVTTRLKAGDTAPPLVFEKALNQQTGTKPELSGRITVLGFFPDTTDNLEAVGQWNATVDRFAGKPVQFVWITGEKEDALVPWLAQHPVKGWVLEDAAGKTGNAYGMEVPENVIVGLDGKIVGFFSGVMQVAQVVRAVQERRATTLRPGKGNLKAFIAERKVLLAAEPRKMPGTDEHRPGFAPSYAVHMSRSEGDEHSSSRSDDFFSLRGYTLEEAIEELYGFTSARLKMASTVEREQHYDFELVLPGRESRERMRERMRAGLLEHFHLKAERGSQSMAVYVLTAVPGLRAPAAKLTGGDFELESIEAPGEADEWKPVKLEAVRGVSWEGSMGEFCHQLEAQLDRPVVNETQRKGEFLISIKAEVAGGSSFLERLRDEAGLVLAPAQREVETLMIRSSTP